MGVSGGHRERGVPEHGRDSVEASARSPKARSRRVPKVMETEVIYASILDGPAKQASHAIAGVALTLPVREHERSG
jgi:hypothetical protein